MRARWILGPSLAIALAMTVRAECPVDAVPPGAYDGFINVKTDPHCGLKGDDRTDDTAALQSCISYWSEHRQALNPATGQPGFSTGSIDWLRFPCGTYVLSDTVRWVGAQPAGPNQPPLGRAYTSLIGERSGCVTIRVPPGTFRDAANPKTLLQLTHPDTAASLFYVDLWNLDFAVHGNPGIRVIDYAANNQVSMRRVRIFSEPDGCHTGIYIGARGGPLLISDTEVEGCRVGLDVPNNYYDVTIQRFLARWNSTGGIRTQYGVGHLHKMKSYQHGSPAILFASVGNATSSDWAIWDVEAHSNAPGYAIQIEKPTAPDTRIGKAYLRDVVVAADSDPSYWAYQKQRRGESDEPPPPPERIQALPSDFSTDTIYTMPALAVPPPLRQELPDHPVKGHPDPADWALITPHGPGVDVAPVISATALTHKVVALAGAQWLGSTVELCGEVERVIGYAQMFAQLPGANVSPIIRICPGIGHPVLLEVLNADRADGTAFIGPKIVNLSDQPVALSDSTHLLPLESLHGGDAHLESVAIEGLQMEGGSAYLSNFNTETPYPPHDIRLKDARLVALGWKTEKGGAGNLLYAENSDVSIFGAFHHCSESFTITNKPLYTLIDSRAELYGIATHQACAWSPTIVTNDSGVLRQLVLRRWAAFRHDLTGSP